MSLPEAARVELPILQELEAIGGSDQLRYLYARLVRYFPQLLVEEAPLSASDQRRRWQTLVRRAGRQLADKGELQRSTARWELTARGRRRLELEALRPVTVPSIPGPAARALTHQEVQARLVEIGRLLGRHAEAEFEHFDVVWREGPAAPRLSHVFEVQIHGSVDSALTRLNAAYQAQRSRPFLVVGDQRSARFAAARLEAAFHPLRDQLTFLGVGELELLYQSLSGQGALLEKLISRD